MAGRDGIVLWDFIADKKGENTHALYGAHGSVVECVAFSPDGSMLASGGADRLLKVWDVGTRTLKYSRDEHTSNVRSVLFSPDGRFLASSSPDDTIRLWEPSTGEALDTLRGNRGNNVLCFSLDGDTLVSAGDAIRIWDVASRPVPDTLKGHSSVVSVARFSSDGKFLASGSAAGEVMLWDLENNVNTLLGHHSSDPVTGDISIDGTLATSSGDGEIKLWGHRPAGISGRDHRAQGADVSGVLSGWQVSSLSRYRWNGSGNGYFEARGDCAVKTTFGLGDDGHVLSGRQQYGGLMRQGRHGQTLGFRHE